MRTYTKELYHHGIKGQKWGVRRYQNEDGSLTSAGKKRYSSEEIREARKSLSSERKKLDELNKRATRIYENTTYGNEKIYDLFLDAQDGWDYKNNRELTDKEIDTNWDKYKKAFDKELSKNKEYSKLLNDIETQKTLVKNLESMANTKTGKDYSNALLGACGSIAVASAGMLVIDYLMSHK